MQASELRFWPREEVVDEDPDAWEEPSRDGKRRGRERLRSVAPGIIKELPVAK